MCSLRRSAPRAALLVGFVLVTCVSRANAAGGEASGDQLRHDAVEALKNERDVAGRANEPGRRPSASLQQQVKTADDKGLALLTQLTAGGYVPSQIVLDTLGRLPAPGSAQPPPTRQRYDQAIRELGGDPGAPPVHTVSDAGWTGGMAALAAGIALLSAVLAVVVVMTLRRRKDKRLVALAMTDSLTSLHNRRRLDEDLVVCTTKQHQPVGVLMVDVDNFKLVNDLQGHAAGDRVLQCVGAVLARNVRPSDLAYRYGGEEFCVLLPEASETDAFRVAERIRQATAALRVPGIEPVTVSVGVAIGTGADVQRTLLRADAAMYDAKRDGRDRVAVAPVTVGSGIRDS
jgi:diguanylate cyclase (GGDEF)-like protein